MTDVMEISSVGNNKWKVEYETPFRYDYEYVYAQDELGAFSSFNERRKKWEKTMRTITICATVVIVIFLTSITYSCQQTRANYTTRMQACLASGKSYVLDEGDGFMCSNDPKFKE